jgi:adenylate kinase family enzyme
VPRVVVVGTSGAGKSTVAAALAALYGVPHVDLDDLATGPRWTRVPDDVFRARVQATLDTPAWIIDGDYQRKLGNRVLEHAEMAIWLDLPLRVSLARMWHRTSQLVREQTELGNGNRLNWNLGLVHWLQWEIRSHLRRRMRMPGRLARHRHLNIVHLRSQSEVDAWLAGQERLLHTR